MKNLIIKLDRKILDVLTQYVRRWVAWYEYKKHAIDMMISWEWFNFVALVVWAITIPTALYIVEGNMIGAVVHAGLWSLLGVLEWFSIQYTKYQMKPLHDYLFSMRENPDYSKAYAAMLEQLFVQSRRKRLETTAIVIGFTTALFVGVHFVINDAPDNMVWQYLFFNAVSMRLRSYLMYVNDFDPPKKKKKASEAITELMQRLWGELVGGFVPRPAFVGMSRLLNSKQ